MNKGQLLLRFGVIPALFIQFVATLFYFVVFTDSEVVGAIYTSTKVLIVIWTSNS